MAAAIPKTSAEKPVTKEVVDHKDQIEDQSLEQLSVKTLSVAQKAWLGSVTHFVKKGKDGFLFSLPENNKLNMKFSGIVPNENPVQCHTAQFKLLYSCEHPLNRKVIMNFGGVEIIPNATTWFGVTEEEYNKSLKHRCEPFCVFIRG